MYFRNIVTYDIRDKGKWKKYQPHKTYTYYGSHTVTVSSLLFYLLIGIMNLIIPMFMDLACKIMIWYIVMICHNDMTLLSLSHARI